MRNISDSILNKYKSEAIEEILSFARECALYQINPDTLPADTASEDTKGQEHNYIQPAVLTHEVATLIEGA